MILRKISAGASTPIRTKMAPVKMFLKLALASAVRRNRSSSGGSADATEAPH